MRWGVRAGLMPGFYVPLLGQTQFAATGAMQKELSSNEVALLQGKGTRASAIFEKATNATQREKEKACHSIK